ncbi:MAG: hypothetical protein LW625_01150 [Planctomycetaceae bacterium]|jgi:hypothetical protein|nr:hypothetical protein [Planctomycetaceae bacterium]
MRLRTSTIQRRHLVPRCVACGQEVAASRAMDVCAGCGCDLADRPARSYAEMEGLVEAVAEAALQDPFVSWRRSLTLERWLLTVFTAAVLLAFTLHVVTRLIAD